MGITLAFLSTIFLTLADTGKKKIALSHDVILVIWITLFIGFICNVIVVLGSDLPTVHWRTVALYLMPCIVFQVLAEILFTVSIARSDISLVMPFKAFAPVFAALVAYGFHGEVPSSTAVIGILLTISGAYLMYLEPSKKGGVFAPFIAALKDRGVIYMILSLFVAQFTANLQRFGSAASSPIFFFTLLLGGQLVLISMLVRSRRLNFFDPIRNMPLTSILTGVLWGIGITCLFVSWSHTLIVYATVISLLQLVLSIPIGYFIFSEKIFLHRVIACIVMVIGVLGVVWGA